MIVTPTLDSDSRGGFIFRKRRKRDVKTLVNRTHWARRLRQGLRGRDFEEEEENEAVVIRRVALAP